MNLVYRLVNRNKEEGRRYYVGSKVECHIAKIDGVATMVQRNNKPYFGSSSSFEMKDDMQRGDVFEVEILEQVKDKKEVMNREMDWINKLDAVRSDEYYNLTSVCPNMHYNSHAVGNKYGQTYAQIAKDRSAVGKRDKNAKKAGFKNFGELVFWIWKNLDEGINMAQSATMLGVGRHRFVASHKIFDKEKGRADVNKTNLQQEIRSMYVQGASLQYISKVLDLELPAARILLGDFNSKFERCFITAKGLGMTREELEVHIAKRVLDGEGLNTVAKDIGVDYQSVKTYFFNFVRAHLKSSDF